MSTLANIVTRWMAPAALLGGAIWILRAVWLALLPAGCVGAACSQVTNSARHSALATPLLALAIALMAVAAIGMMVQAFLAERMGWLGRAGTIALAMAGAELAVYALASNLFDNQIKPLAAMGGPLLILGILLTGAALLRAGALHRSAIMALLLGSVAMLGYNDQNAQVLLALPFGVAWLVVGLTLLLKPEPQSTAQATASPSASLPN
ncbi:MAG TPA: hypothetical protein VFI42_07845 [Thermomicrobiaceae bacterium]|nr:hypothetical protein [Thermomicrobiaceae bacterium]